MSEEEIRNFEFLLDEFTEEELSELERVVPDIHHTLICLVKKAGLGRAGVSGIVRRLIEEKCKRQRSEKSN